MTREVLTGAFPVRAEPVEARFASAGTASALMLIAALAISSIGCNRKPAPPVPPPLPRLSVDEVVRLIPPDIDERRGWAEDVLAAFEAHSLWPDAPSVCSVLAVIEQESNYRANPQVPDLSGIVRRELKERLSKLGPVGEPVLKELLAGKAPETKESFDTRLKKVRTERDLDKLFRDLLDFYRAEWPKIYQAANLASELSGRGALDDWNPITTAGSMQVAVDYALKVAKEKGKEQWAVRDSMYTRDGGVYYGAARLLAYPAQYDRPLYRFADFNAGFYASRNAALQEQLSAITGIDLVPDGDLLLYGKDDQPLSQESNTLKALLRWREKYAPQLSEWTLRREVKLEKERVFEDSETYAALRQSYQAKTGKTPGYARLPEVSISSPKMRHQHTTAWFAQSVDARFERCMGRNVKRP